MYDPKRQAKIALAASYICFALAFVQLGYVAYNAIANGRSAIMLFRSRTRFDYLFQDQPGQALLVLAVNIVFALLLVAVARECYAEKKIWQKE
jgi:putative copper export protein